MQPPSPLRTVSCMSGGRQERQGVTRAGLAACSVIYTARVHPSLSASDIVSGYLSPHVCFVPPSPAPPSTHLCPPSLSACGPSLRCLCDPFRARAPSASSLRTPACGRHAGRHAGPPARCWAPSLTLRALAVATPATATQLPGAGNSEHLAEPYFIRTARSSASRWLADTHSITASAVHPDYIQFLRCSRTCLPAPY